MSIKPSLPDDIIRDMKHSQQYEQCSYYREMTKLSLDGFCPHCKKKVQLNTEEDLKKYQKRGSKYFCLCSKCQRLMDKFYPDDD